VWHTAHPRLNESFRKADFYALHWSSRETTAEKNATTHLWPLNESEFSFQEYKKHRWKKRWNGRFHLRDYFANKAACSFKKTQRCGVRPPGKFRVHRCVGALGAWTFPEPPYNSSDWKISWKGSWTTNTARPPRRGRRQKIIPSENRRSEGTPDCPYSTIERHDIFWLNTLVSPSSAFYVRASGTSAMIVQTQWLRHWKTRLRHLR